MTTLGARAVLLVVLASAIVACPSGNAGRVMVIGESVLTYYEPGERPVAKPAEGESLLPGPRIERSLIEGKVAVVHFWGSWCGPCRREQPVFVKISDQYRARGVQFLGVDSRRDQRRQAILFWNSFGTKYPSIFDPPSRLAAAWGVGLNFPQTFVLDKEGKIAAAFNGAVDDELALVKILDEELVR